MNNILIKVLAFIAGFLLGYVVNWPANAHGEHSWIEDFEAGGTVVVGQDSQEWLEPPGGSCCGKNDVVVIDPWVASAAYIGGFVTITIDGRTMKVKVTKIYQTQDPRGRSYMSRHGCLFRMNST